MNGSTDIDGVWRACRPSYPMCMGRAARDCCTCLPRERWCKCENAIVPRKGMLCIDCANARVAELEMTADAEWRGE